MNKLIALMAGGAALASASVATAQEYSLMRTFASGSYQLTFDSSDRPNDEGHGIHLSFGHFFTRNLALELAADYSEFSGDGSNLASGGVDRDGSSLNIKLGGLLAFNRGGRFEPYVGLGGGLANNELDDPDDNRRRAFGEATIGVFAPISMWWGLRGEFAYRYTDGIPTNPPGAAKSSANEALLRIGMLFPLTRELPMVVQAQPEPDPVTDSDGDGVPDRLDECPGTPAGVRVNARGCPLDSDADGVPDYLDECPGTAAGVQVDETGCPVSASIERKFEDINFGFDKSNLTDYARSTLSKTAAELKALAERDDALRINVEGHTDSTGPADYNMQLGQDRATTVRDYLVGQGVDAARISTSSSGESQPIATNDTAKGRLLNRRVEIRATAE